MQAPENSRGARWQSVLPLLVALCCALTGCRGTGLAKKDGEEGFAIPSLREMFTRKRDRDIRRMADIGDIQGPGERSIRNALNARTASLEPAAGRSEFEALEPAYRKGQYKLVEKRAKKLAKKYKKSPVREDFLFLVAECQFHQKKYSWAQDSYDTLLNEFKSSRHLDHVSRRMFHIAKSWLEDPGYVTSGDVVPASFGPETRATGPRSKQPQKKYSVWTAPSRAIPIFPNFWDRSRPIFDTDGRALQALRSIWMKDPTGPLADDALMLTAGYYLQRGRHLEADHIYTILREDYGKSKHVENAYVLGSHVKLASFQGADYDGKVLSQAEQLKKRTLKLYPNHRDAARIKDDLRKINEAKAAQDWAVVVFYQRKNKPAAVRTYCQELVRKFPNTTYADRARQILNKSAPSPTAERTGAPPPKPGPRRLFPVPKLPRLLPPPRREPDGDPPREELPRERDPARVRV